MPEIAVSGICGSSFAIPRRRKPCVYRRFFAYDRSVANSYSVISNPVTISKLPTIFGAEQRSFKMMIPAATPMSRPS